MNIESIKEEQWTRLKRVLNYIQKKKKRFSNPFHFLKRVRANLFFHCSYLLKDTEDRFWISINVEGQCRYVNENLDLISTPPDGAEIIEYDQYMFLISCRDEMLIDGPCLGKGLCVREVVGVDYEQYKEEFEAYLLRLSCPQEMFKKFHEEIKLNGFFFTTVQDCVWSELLRKGDDNVLELHRCPSSVRIEFCAPFPGRGVNPEIKREMIKATNHYVEAWSDEEECLNESI